ncbi:MAG: hypothetical protein HC888_02850 [Candidatus Competibacteraceae bacterium]|nr:hypothetical protein [Candidatus Competibacteraceae bacterium]
MRLPNIITALYKGHQLANSVGAQKTGVGLALVVPLMSVLAQVAVANGWVDSVADETILRISETLLMLVSPVLAYIIAATTGNIGFKDRKEPNQNESDTGQ